MTYSQGNCPAAQLTASSFNLSLVYNCYRRYGFYNGAYAFSAVPGITNYFVSQTNRFFAKAPVHRSLFNVVGLSVYIGLDTTICQGDTARFTPNVIPAADSSAWRSITAGVPNSTILTQTWIDTKATPVDNVKYVLRATLNGCNMEDTVLGKCEWKPIIKCVCLMYQRFCIAYGKRERIPQDRSLLMHGHLPRGSILRQLFKHGRILSRPVGVGSLQLLTLQLTVAHSASYDSVKLVVQPPVHAFAGNDPISSKKYLPHQLHGSGGVNSASGKSPTALISNPFSQNPTTTLLRTMRTFISGWRMLSAVQAIDPLFIKVYDQRPVFSFLMPLRRMATG